MSKKKKMLKDLSGIAKYLEDAGFVEEACEVQMAIDALDGINEQQLNDHYTLPTIQMNNLEGSGYIGGDGVGGGYSMLSVPVGQMADDEQENVDAFVGMNGQWGNTVTENAGAGQFNVLSDSYFYQEYDNLEGNYG